MHSFHRHYGRGDWWDWDNLGAWAREMGRRGAREVSLVEGLLRTGAYVEPELEETLAEFGLTRPSFQVLVALLRADDHRMTQSRLSRVVRRTSGTISLRLARLEKAGLVTREPDPEDGRGVVVSLTDEGRRRVEAALPAYAEACERLAVGLGDDAAGDLLRQVGEWLGFFEGEGAGEAGPQLGIAVAPAHVAQRMRRAVGLPDRVGVLVRGVSSGSPAEAAGLTRGDLVTGAGGEAVRTIAELQRAVAGAAGGSLALEVVRGVDELELKVQLPAS